jgi:hypothetical protein
VAALALSLAAGLSLPPPLPSERWFDDAAMSLAQRGVAALLHAAADSGDLSHGLGVLRAAHERVSVEAEVEARQVQFEHIPDAERLSGMGR